MSSGRELIHRLTATTSARTEAVEQPSGCNNGLKSTIQKLDAVRHAGSTFSPGVVRRIGHDASDKSA